MSTTDDSVIANAAAAAATPANGPPPPDALGGIPVGHADQRVIDRQRREQESAAARETALTPVEREIAQIRANPKFIDKNSPEQPTLVARLKQLVTNQTSEEERDAWDAVPLREKREFFDLGPPTLPAPLAEAYEENFGAWEGDLITLARNEGLPSATVRGLRDAAVDLSWKVDGAPLADEIVNAALAKFPTLTSAQRTHLVALWRRVEGGGA